jgi:uncharacterized protein (UPF0335 family)
MLPGDKQDKLQKLHEAGDFDGIRAMVREAIKELAQDEALGMGPDYDAIEKECVEFEKSLEGKTREELDAILEGFLNEPFKEVKL